MARRRFILLLCLALSACRNDKAPTASSTSAKVSPSGAGATPSSSAVHAGKSEADTLSHASEAYDAGPPVIASGAVDGAALRKRHAARLKSERSSPDITRALTPGARLPFALYRLEGRSPRRYLAFSPPRTAKPNFHVPEAFATLVLEAN